jgi:hypothetical protein
MWYPLFHAQWDKSHKWPKYETIQIRWNESAICDVVVVYNHLCKYGMHLWMGIGRMIDILYVCVYINFVLCFCTNVMCGL